MKRLATYSLLAFVFFSPLPAEGRTNDSKEELVNLDRRLGEALYGSGDLAALDALLAEDWRGGTAFGESHSKAELFEQIKRAQSGPKKSPARIEVSPAEVRVYIHGDTAVVSGSLRMKLNGEEVSPIRYVNVYMRHGGRWLAISTHDC